MCSFPFVFPRDFSLYIGFPDFYRSRVSRRWRSGSWDDGRRRFLSFTSDSRKRKEKVGKTENYQIYDVMMDTFARRCAPSGCESAGGGHPGCRPFSPPPGVNLAAPLRGARVRRQMGGGKCHGERENYHGDNLFFHGDSLQDMGEGAWRGRTFGCFLYGCRSALQAEVM